jgi:uncharacterized protein YegP (UPF0339 family)
VILTAEQVVQVATVLLPGFVALKILYAFGFRSKRTDLEWAVWSLLGSLALAPLIAGLARQVGATDPGTFAGAVRSCAEKVIDGSLPADEKTRAVVDCASSALSSQFNTPVYFLIAFVAGVALGVLLLGVWAVLRRLWPNLGSIVARTAWDKYTDRDEAPYVELTLGEGKRLSGVLTEAATTVEVDEPDVYVTKPAWYDEDTDSWVDLDMVEGMWVPHGEIKELIFMKPSSVNPGPGGRYIIRRAADGQYYFVLSAANGEIIAQSERYTSKSGARAGIDAVQENAVATRIEDEAGE